jgi:hypothetical protein
MEFRFKCDKALSTNSESNIAILEANTAPATETKGFLGGSTKYDQMKEILDRMGEASAKVI